jgi:hypothetical protein
MKLDPGMHIGLHLVSFGKSGVTLASWLDKHYTTYLSEKQHFFVLGCACPFEVWPSSSCQHGLVGDAIANPSWILPLSKP